MSIYFTNNPATLKNLIYALQTYYGNKKKNPDFKLTLKEFIDLFPRDSSLKNNNFRKQHVFESICKLLLLFNYDANYFDSGKLYNKDKLFYTKLEEWNELSKEVSKTDILNTNINDGNTAGSVDIFFKLTPDTKEKSKVDKSTKFACEDETICQISKGKSSSKEDKFILIQNKYYDNESANVTKYDATKIYRRAQHILKEEENTEIVLMVNNGNILDSKLKDMDKSNIKIIGIEIMDLWFQKMLVDLYIEPDLDKFIGLTKRDTEIIQPRFHQKLFIEKTNRYITEHKRKKFIWGAVPRSGKSYMIGGMISKRKEQSNDVIIVLGAKSETETQFEDLLDYKNGTNKFVDFKDYGYLGPGKKEPTKPQAKNIYIFSQEFLKVHKKNLESSDLKKLRDLKKKKKKL